MPGDSHHFSREEDDEPPGSLTPPHCLDPPSTRSPSSSTSLRFEFTPHTRPIRLRTPADLCALALRYLDRHACALSSATPRATLDYDEFRPYVTILLICSPSHIPRLPMRSPLPYTYSRHVICVSDGTEFLGTTLQKWFSDIAICNFFLP